MNNHGIPPSSSSTMAPSTFHSPSTVQVSPSHGHSMQSMPPPQNSAERKMGILRADSGIAITPNTHNAISNPDQIKIQSNALPKDDPIDTIPTDASGATSTFNMNDIANIIAKLDQLNTHLRTILTPVPSTSIAYLDDSTSTGELSPEEEIPYTSAEKEEEEDPCDTSTDTSEATIAEDMSGTISKIDQILEQISAIRHITSTMPSSLDEFLLKDSIIPESNIEKGKGKGKGKGKEEKEEQTRIKPTIPPKLLSASLPPSSPSAEYIQHRARRFQWVSELLPPQESSHKSNRSLPTPLRLRRRIRRMKERKENAEQTPTKPIKPIKPITSSNLPPSSPSAERILRRARTFQWISNLPPPQESSYRGNRSLPTTLFLQRRIRLMKEQSKEEFPFTPTSNVLDPYYWTLRDALAFDCSLFSQPAKNPIPASPKEKHPTRPQPPKEEAEAILVGPYSEPSMSRPLTSKPWISRPSKKEASRKSKSAGVSRGGEAKEGGKGEGEKNPRIIITRMMIFGQRPCMEDLLKSICGEKEEKEERDEKNEN
ncbi:hypothetical protein BCON_0064g00010 [Botryotinia convoluta]|uniref:Uncharacterized protein n=1 Tax=Botryotinia convoluta TaxID=54673 RepID=A0A4Z1IA30_9HELO|nr:hypothetical protein BCON_0064g00010 [Botryotinia convoluta]